MLKYLYDDRIVYSEFFTIIYSFFTYMSEEQQRPLRKWYQKKRFIIPLVIFVLFIFGGIVNSDNTQTTTAQTGIDNQQESQNQEENSLSEKKIYQEVIAAERQAKKEACGWGDVPPDRNEGETDKEYMERIACGGQESEDAVQAVLDKHGISDEKWSEILVKSTNEAWPMESAEEVNEEEPVEEKVEESEEVQEDNETVSQKNAIRKAESYLNMTGFSKSGLIEQLEFEGFSNEDAVYGVENVNVDWNEQAEKKAESYMEYSAFSRAGLIEQLVFEGFTTEQANHGADAVGL